MEISEGSNLSSDSVSLVLELKTQELTPRGGGDWKASIKPTELSGSNLSRW